MRKIFYFSGIHGIGKTTIIKKIKEQCIPDATILDFDQFYLYPKDFLENQIYRINNYYQTVKNTDAPLILMDRGPFDSLLYAETLHVFEDETGFTQSNLNSVRMVFRMIPPEFYMNSYVIFLNLSMERVMQNIRARNREADKLMLREDFVNELRDRFTAFYEQVQKIMNVAIFEGDMSKSYSPRTIVEELQRRGWLQPYEVNKEYRLKKRETLDDLVSIY